MNGFSGVYEHLVDFKHEWNDFINGSRELPDQFNDMNDFNKIVLYKIMKPQKVQDLVQQYVLNKLGEFYAYPPINSIKDSF